VGCGGELTAGGVRYLFVGLLWSEGVLLLICEVKWVRPHSDGYFVGLALFDSDGSEIIDWKLAMAKYLN